MKQPGTKMEHFTFFELRIIIFQIKKISKNPFFIRFILQNKSLPIKKRKMDTKYVVFYFYNYISCVNTWK